jgi:hemoglobin-like flavoprotein
VAAQSANAFAVGVGSRQLGALGAKHVDYGVRPEVYDWVVDALLVTLAEAAGPLWSDELHAQWAEAYATIASLMRAGETDARASGSTEAAPASGESAA